MGGGVKINRERLMQGKVVSRYAANDEPRFPMTPTPDPSVPSFTAEGTAVRKEPLHDDDIFVIHDFLTPEECARFIATSVAVGYGDAAITTSGGPLITFTPPVNGGA